MHVCASGSRAAAAASRARAAPSTTAMNSSWPSSTPTLKAKSASGTSCCGQADRGQRAGEAEPVQQAERERDHPRPLRRQAWPAAPRVQDLRGEQQDAERDRGFDGRPGHVNNAERGERERDRVRDREGRDRPHEHARAAHDQHQREDEQQMVVAEQDVLDAVRSRRRRRPRWALAPRQSRATVARDGRASSSARAVAKLHAREDVGDGGLQPDELDALAGEAARRPRPARRSTIESENSRTEASVTLRAWSGSLRRPAGACRRARGVRQRTS